MKFYFVRHGESMGNIDSSCYSNDDCNFLTKFGVKQAELCGAYFRRRGIVFNKLVSSGLTRARHTMSVILQEMDMPARMWLISSQLNEVIHQTDKDRIIQEFGKIKDIVENSEGNILIVTHYHTMQVMWDVLGLQSDNIPGNGKIIRNAVPFVWNPALPNELQLIELNDIRYNIRND